MPINTNKLIALIKEEIQKQLPGREAHQLMSPRHRVLNPTNEQKPRPSAVLIMLYPKNSDTHIVMIKRAEYDGVHSGQIAFPGGKKDKNDKDLLDTALRETFEEIGVRRNDLDIIGKLSPLFIPVSNMCVHPWIGFYKDRPVFVKQDKEVQQVLSIPLIKLLEEEAITQSIFSGQKYEVEAPCYHVDGLRIWGASAMILSEFLAIVHKLPLNKIRTP